jgi:3-oxoacyl-[acyl-carrier-protein] synthase-3
MRRSRILGLGRFLPERRVTNFDLANMFETSDEWIQQRSGIVERRYADEGVYCSDLALEATQRALENANMKVEDVDFIILATLSPDHHFPGTACYLQKKLGLPEVGCLDIRNQCSGFVYSLAVADAFVRIGMYERILVVGSEVHSSALNYTKEGRDVTVLFGDGAGAAIVGPSEDPERGILSSHLHADGRYADALKLELWDISKKPYMTHERVEEGDIWPKMKGREVFRMAVTKIPEVIEEALSFNQISLDQIKLFIPHQANLRINQFSAAKLEVPEEKFFSNIENYGNTTAGSIPIALGEALEQGAFGDGDLIVLVAFGAGFTWGATVIRW